jgi:invasion protein IalB
MTLFAQASIAQVDAVEKNNPKVFAEQYDDWTYQCVSSANDDNSKQEPAISKCEITQLVRKFNKNGVIQSINLSLAPAIDKTGEFKWALLISSPLNLDIHLPSELSLGIKNKKLFQTRFRSCNTQGCQAIIPTSSSLLEKLKRANDVRVQFKILDGQATELSFSLIGFTKAFNAISSGVLPQEQKSFDKSTVVEERKFKIVAEQYDDWIYQCLVPTSETTQGKYSPDPKCEITQTVQKDLDGGVVNIIKMSLSQVNNEADPDQVEWTMAMWLPLGLDVHLPSEFGLFVGTKKPFLSQFENCNPQGCKVLIPVSSSLLKDLKQSEEGAVRFRLLDAQVVDVKFSLRGFVRAFDTLGSGALPRGENS